MTYCIASSSSRWLHHETNGEPRNRQVDTGNLEPPTPELTNAHNAGTAVFGAVLPLRYQWLARQISGSA
jgi:hypothetical protein